MSMIMLLMDLFFNPEAPRTSFNERFLGYGLLLIAMSVGLYFLFQTLIPMIGYIESGAAVSLILAVLGSSILFFSMDKKKVKNLEKMVDTAKSSYNHVEDEIEVFFKNNSTRIILYSCLAGLTLYQILNLMKDKTAKE